MAKIEIEESELANLKAVNTFVEAGLKNPKTRTQLLGVQKTLNPEAVIPELDAAEGVMKSVNAISERLDGFMKKLDERDTQSEETRRTNALQEKMTKGQQYLRDSGYGDDGVKKIEELMLQEGISSYAAGMAYFERLNPPPKPSNGSSSRWPAPIGDIASPDNKALWESQGDDDTWLHDAINAASPAFRQ